MKTILSLFILAALAGLCTDTAGAAARFAPPGAAQGQAPKQVRKYKIYCAGGTVQIENLTMDEMERERKVRPCELSRAQFVSLSAARKAAKRFGGVGAPCRCAASGKKA